MNYQRISIVGITLVVAVVCTVISFSTHKSEQESESILREKMAPSDHFDLMRSYPDLTPDIKGEDQALHMAHLMSQIPARQNGFDESWTVEGPGNIGARINAIAVPDGKPDTIFIGYAKGGIFRTYDGGTTWDELFEDEERLCIGALAINPLSDDVIYAGTGDRNIGGSFTTGNGIYKSTDGGNTWENKGLIDQKIISDIAINPQDTSIIYASAMGIPSLPNSDRGVYKSTDGGDSWTQVLFINDSAGVNQVEINPNNPDVLYATGWNRIRTNQVSVVSGSAGRIWKSEDAGANWVELSNGLPTGDQGRVGLAIFTPNPDTLYSLFVGNNSQLYGVYRTMDGGDSWSLMSSGGGVTASALGGFGWYFSGIYVNPSNYLDVFFEGIQLWRSGDGGIGWNEADPPWWTYEVHADKHAMHFIDANTFLLGTDGGLYKTTDNTVTWTKIENNKTNEFYRVAHTHFDAANYYGGMQDNGSSGGNASLALWPRIYGGDGFQMKFSATDEDLFYCETQNGNIVYSDDGGFSFGSCAFPDNANRTNWDTPYILSAHSSTVMYAASHRVWRDDFTPYGSWTLISPDLTDGNIFGSAFHSISGIDESTLNDDHLYACTTDGNVWKTEDGGTNWDSIHTGLPNRYVTSVKASYTDDEHVFVTHSGYKYNDFFAHVHKSEDNGSTWVDISGDLPPVAVNDIVIYPGTNDSLLFVATDAGVYGTIDAGAEWERVGTNMPMIEVRDLEFDTVNNRLIAATFGRSIMTYPMDSVLSNFTIDDSVVTALVVSGISQDMTCVETANGSITTTVVGGVPPYTYVWSTGDTTTSLSGLSSGTYTVTVSDANSDIGTASFTLIHNPIHPQPVLGSLVGPASVQAWQSYNYNVDPTSGSSFEWQITGGSLNSSTSNAASILWNAGPQGSVTIIETDVNGCISDETHQVDILFVGEESQLPTTEIKAYPNPIQGATYLAFDPTKGRLDVSVYSVTGEQVLTETLASPNEPMYLDQLSSGSYFVHWKQGESTGLQKVIKN